jgi:hypothetical protein
MPQQDELKMLIKSVEAARKELWMASVKLAEVECVESDPHRLLTLWSDFLGYANRVYNKLSYGPKLGSSKGWFDSVKHFRKEDTLLRYILHARDADAHGVENITANPNLVSVTIEPLSWYVNKPVRGKIIESGRVKSDGSFEFENLMVQTTRVVLHLVPVTDRGILYHPPTVGEYFGEYLSEVSPIGVATIAIRYLTRIIGEAESYATRATPKS